MQMVRITFAASPTLTDLLDALGNTHRGPSLLGPDLPSDVPETRVKQRTGLGSFIGREQNCLPEVGRTSFN
jgi:hypothetical protein